MGLMWQLRRRFWDGLAVLKYRYNKPAEIPIPQGDGQQLKAVSFESAFPGIPIPNILVADSVPKDEASRLKYLFYQAQVALYSLFPPMQEGLPPVDPDPQRALDDAYTPAHRKCFPAPILPNDYRGDIDLGHLAIASPYACYLERAPEGGFQWDLRKLDRYELHDGLRRLGVRVLFTLDSRNRRLRPTRIDSELGTSRPGDAHWQLSQKLALCAATTHLSLVRHFNWVHLAVGGPLAIATRNNLGARHPVMRLLWPHIYGTQYSNQIVTLGQMARGGDFETIFSFTHAGMCKLFSDTYAEYDAVVLSPGLEAEQKGVRDAGFDTPALDSRMAYFELMRQHALRYLRIYYASDEQLREDTSLRAWITELGTLIPGGIHKLLGDALTLESAARLIGAFLYLETVEHEIVGSGVWNYQLWTQVQPVRMYKNGHREPLDVYQRLINANFNLNVHRRQLLADFSYLALDTAGAAAFQAFRKELEELQVRMSEEPAGRWMIYPEMLKANINA
ncbi:lipoxygenase family protein [Hyalangium gracile]|uniref:lipoxygenase family protein n=1 Tax=Hyalangium gracile TaxID=394092 RepID=UPI001CCD4C5A|nr:lipoxygenase family protein [Hyalangium gracile]